MKGLILKDIYGVRFQILAGMAILLFPMLMLMLSPEVMNDSSGLYLGESPVFLLGVVNYCSITVCSSFLLNTLGYDEKSGWSKMQRTMPLTGGRIIGAKFIVMGVVLGVLTLLSLIVNLVLKAIYDLPLEPMIALPLCIGSMQIITLSPTITLGYRFGARSTMTAYIGLVVLFATCGIWLTIVLFAGNVSTFALRMICYVALPALTAATLALSWVTGKKAVMIDI